MAIIISKTDLKVYLILLLFTIVCVMIGYYLGMQYNLEYANEFYQNYINESCVCRGALYTSTFPEVLY